MKKIFIQDPVHRGIQFPEYLYEPIEKIIHTKTFQRLRRISQLGMTSLVFPGATHSRFSHSLGAAYLANEALDTLEKNADHGFKKKIKDNRKNIVISTLLHDIGHGPFSHSFEKVKLLKNEENISHEDWTKKIINSECSDIHKAIKEDDGLNLSCISSPFDKGQEEGQEGGMKPYFKKIISSQVDVDRMDYLLRDSFFSGVHLGKINIDYLISCLTISGPSEKSRDLLIKKKGVNSYESYIWARHLMNKSLFLHPKVRVADFMLVRFLNKIISCDYCRPDGYDFFKNCPGEKKDQFMKNKLNDYLEITDDAIYCILNRSRLQNKCDKSCSDLAKRFLKRDLYTYREIKHGKESVLKKLLIDKKFKDEDKNGDKEFHIDHNGSTPYKDGKKSQGGESVFVFYKEGKLKDISKASYYIESFKDKEEGVCLLILLDDKIKCKIEEIKGIEDLIYVP